MCPTGPGIPQLHPPGAKNPTTRRSSQRAAPTPSATRKRTRLTLWAIDGTSASHATLVVISESLSPSLHPVILDFLVDRAHAPGCKSLVQDKFAEWRKRAEPSG